MSETPETDKAWKAGIKMSAEESEDFLRQHAQKLERERDKARRLAEHYRDAEAEWESDQKDRLPWEEDQIGPCKRPDLCMLDKGHIPCPVCPNDPSIAPSLACSAFERAAQICRYYLKHQNHPSRWDDKSDYEQGVQIACENLAVLMLEEVGKFKVEAGSSLEELAANWERAGFGNVAVAIRDSEQNAKGDLSAVAD